MLTRAYIDHLLGLDVRSLEEFVALLQSAGIELLVDVRSIPRSRTNPQFNLDSLPAELRRHEIGFEHLAELGGRRGRVVADSPNTFWENASFRNYADYAATEPFRRGLARLRGLGETRQTAIMCAEAVWWRCHRRIIADYLICAGETVLHILAPGKIESAKLTPAAHEGSDGSLIYSK